ncbi:MAG: cell division protein FtsH, partial [Clostridiaceae bacterium]|nr:cell division protein FtsH [Clostridiaceae bacterium]
MNWDKFTTYFLMGLILLPIIVCPFIVLKNPSYKPYNSLSFMKSTVARNYTDADMRFNDFKGMVESGKVQKVYYNEVDSVLEAEDKSGKAFTFENPKNSQFRQYLLEHKVIIKESSSVYSTILNFILFSIIIS